MKRLLCLIVCVMMCSGCATTYFGFTTLRIKAKDFKANCGPFHQFVGQDVDAMLTRDCTITGDAKRKIGDTPDIKMTATGSDSMFEVVK